jgi:hypothetical protein
VKQANVLTELSELSKACSSEAYGYPQPSGVQAEWTVGRGPQLDWQPAA